MNPFAVNNLALTESRTPSDDDSRLFLRLIIGLSVLMGSYTVVRWYWDGDLYRAVGPLLIFLGGLVCWQVNRRGFERASFVLYIWIIWAALTQQAIVRTGMANPALHGYVVIMLLGSWWLGVGQGIYIGLASAVATGLMAAAMEAGLWTPVSSAGPTSYWFGLVTVWSTGILMMSLIQAQHWRQVRRTHELNHQLAASLDELRLRSDELERSRERFAKVSEASPIPIAISHLADGRYIDVNPAWVRTFGWSREEAIDHTSIDIGFWPDVESRLKWKEQLSRDGCTMGLEVQTMTRDGQRCTVRLYAELIEHDGQPAVLVLFFDDTERASAEAKVHQLNEELEQRVRDRTAALASSNHELSTALQTLKRAQEELVHSEKLASLGHLVAGVAHELNTPIGNALTAASTLEDLSKDFRVLVNSGNLKKSTLTHFVEQCEDGAGLTTRSLRRAADLVASFKQVAIDQASERRRSFDLRVVVTEVVDTLRPTLKGQPWDVKVAVADGVQMDSYPGPLDQIIINLVLNATVHAFIGRNDGLILLSATDIGNGAVELRCQDDGNGIPPDVLQRIFDPFFTTRLGQGGSGLGLAIVHRLATQVLGGQIRVESTLGEGSCFILNIPRLAPELVV
jgi:PAS domain S-box-containing protein